MAGNPALTTPDAARLDGLLAGLELMVCVDPYLNATTRHAHVILPPPSVLEKSHYDLAFTGLSVRDFARLVAARASSARKGSPSEFDILVRLAAIAAGLGAAADPNALATATLHAQVEREVADPASPVHGRDAAEITAALGAEGRPPEEQLLDLLLRTGHRGDGFGSRPDGLSLDVLERHPHGIDFGPLGSRLPEALATESGKVELAPPELIDDLSRLERALDATAAGGMVLVGRRQLRTANSWTHNVPVLVRGKESCVAQIHPDDAARLGPRRRRHGGCALGSRFRRGAGRGHRRRHAGRRLHPVRLGPRAPGHAPVGRSRARGGKRQRAHGRVGDRSRLGERRPQRHPGHRRPAVIAFGRIAYTASAARYPARELEPDT